MKKIIITFDDDIPETEACGRVEAIIKNGKLSRTRRKGVIRPQYSFVVQWHDGMIGYTREKESDTTDSFILKSDEWRP